jgi:hypothetical protein
VRFGPFFILSGSQTIKRSSSDIANGVGGARRIITQIGDLFSMFANPFMVGRAQHQLPQLSQHVFLFAFLQPGRLLGFSPWTVLFYLLQNRKAHQLLARQLRDNLPWLDLEVCFYSVLALLWSVGVPDLDAHIYPGSEQQRGLVIFLIELARFLLLLV